MLSIINLNTSSLNFWVETSINSYAYGKPITNRWFPLVYGLIKPVFLGGFGKVFFSFGG